MTAVAQVKPHLKALAAPDELRNLPSWLMWRYETVPGRVKPLKVPYYTGGGKRSGVQGSAEDRQALTTFDAAKAAAARRGFDGVGFALMPEWGITALDFDNCVTAGGVHPDVLDLIADTYAEYSPSGTGVRALVKGSLGNRKDPHAEPFGFESFTSKGYVTYTGNPLDIVTLIGNENTIAPVTQQLKDFYARRFASAAETSSSPFESESKPVGLTTSQIEQALAALPPDLGYDEWVKVGMAVHHETRGEGFELWESWSQTSPKYSSREYNWDRWDSFGRNPDRPVTAGSLIRLANAHGAGIDLSGFSLDDFDDISTQPATPLEATNSAEGQSPKGQAATEKIAKSPRFPVLTASEFSLRPSPDWIIKGVLPKAELVVLFGESGSGKSFIALDLAGCIARGLEWRGRRTKQGRVVYVAAEGAGGFRNRLKAYASHNDIDLSAFPFGVIHAAPNLLLKDDALDVAKSIVAAGGADVVIVDTFAQVTPGANENAAEDMGKALGHCKGIHRATGAVVLLVHHSGKDSSKGARGWSGLKAAADAELEVLRLPQGRMLRTSKQKDGEDGLEWGFNLEVVPVGADADGDPITSCIVAEAAVPAGGKGAALVKLGPVEMAVNSVIQEFAVSQNEGIEVEAVLKEAVKRLDGPADGKRDTRRQRARRALETLTKGDEAPYFLEDGCLTIL